MLREAGVKGVGFSLILVSAGLAIVWIAIAARDWLALSIGANWAALVVGLALLLPALGYAVATMIAARRAEARVQIDTPQMLHEETKDDAMSVIAARVFELVRERPLVALTATVVAGVLIVRFPGPAVSMARLLTTSRA